MAIFFSLEIGLIVFNGVKYGIRKVFEFLITLLE
jgi:hypothetical protein